MEVGLPKRIYLVQGKSEATAFYNFCTITHLEYVGGQTEETLVTHFQKHYLHRDIEMII